MQHHRRALGAERQRRRLGQLDVEQRGGVPSRALEVVGTDGGLEQLAGDAESELLLELGSACCQREQAGVARQRLRRAQQRALTDPGRAFQGQDSPAAAGHGGDRGLDRVEFELTFQQH